MNEQRLVRALADDADLAGVVAVRPRKPMHDVELAAIEVADNARADVLVDIALHRNVDLAPGDALMDVISVDDKAVVR